MTVSIELDDVRRELPSGPPPRRRVVIELARAEARRNLRSPWIWGGVAAAAWAGRMVLSADYQSGAYEGVIGSFATIAAAIFVLGVLSGSRDRSTTSALGLPLGEATLIDDDQRAAARLLGLLPVVLVGAIYVALVMLAARLEGGFWVGNEPGRTDTARHGLFEALQPVVLFLAAGAAGVAAGRTRAPRTLVCIVGVFTICVSGLFWWAWQSDVTVVAALVQTQPITVPITEVGEVVDFDAIPSEWLLKGPDRYDMRWSHLVIDQRLAAAHDLYLLGLAAVAAGLAVRGRPGWVVAAGGGVAVVCGVVAQVSLFPGA